MEPHQLSRQEARRIAVRAQLLSADRPVAVAEVVEHLAMLQVDLTAAVAPSHHLVLWSRLGSAYQRAELEDAVAAREYVELSGMLRPAADVALYRAEMASWPGTGELLDWQEYLVDWVDANEAGRQDILETLAEAGPLPATDLPDSCLVPWKSTGWSNNKNVVRMLDFLAARGEVAVAGRAGTRGRLWDLAERVYPDVAPVPAEEAVRERDARRLRALGVARAKAPKTPNEPDHVGEAGEPAQIEGVRGRWRVDPAYLEGDLTGRCALLSPLDRLVFDRARLRELFEFDYQLEMYKPAAKRRWGYWAMPILYDDRLVGKLDATADPEAGALVVDAVHQDVPFTPAMTTAVEQEIADLATWLELEPVRT